LSLKVAPGQFFFAENGSVLCAIRFMNKHGWDRASYESYLIPQRQGEPSFTQTEPKSGEVFELLNVKDKWGDKTLVEDAGSQVNVACGGSSITWSSGNWIYSRDEWRFAVTRCATLECAQEQYATVTWQEGEQ
jgi:hypothetical protein